MKLVRFHVKDFKSVKDSGPIDVSDVTCLVGKNESGKTSLLQALYRLNPIIPEHAKYDLTDDFPRAEVEDYRQAIEAKTRKPSTVIEVAFDLDPTEIAVIEAEFGKGIMKNAQFTYSKQYGGGSLIGVSDDEKKAGLEMLKKAGMDSELEAGAWTDLSSLHQLWSATAEQKVKSAAAAMAAATGIADPDQKKAAEAKARALEETNSSKEQRAALAELLKRGLSLTIWDKYIEPKLPKFLYFDEYYQMHGHVNIEALNARETQKTLLDSDYPMLGLIDLARLKLDTLTTTTRTEELISKLEGASNHLSRKILKYWSQNKHLSVRFDVRPARPNDPKGMETGTNLLGRVYDSVHLVSTPLGTRSKGFVWFFSFIAWFSQQQKRGEQMILLLDEPGLVLHGTAQADLLLYIEEELKPSHQVIYTTHSPFMVEPTRFDRVRIVEDKSMEADGELPAAQMGTKVYTDVLEVSSGSLFPLQGALGYELSQTLFVGPNNLIVEGVSDLLYLQEISSILRSKGKVALDDAWTITPVGGSEKVATFVALLGGQKKLKIATLIDVQNKDRQQIENLYKRRLLQKKNVLTFADFTGSQEADIEDMFEADFYLQLVNAEYQKGLAAPVTVADLAVQHPRVLVRLEKYFEQHPLNGESFNHFRPARYFSSQIDNLKPKLSTTTLDRFEAAFKTLNALL